MPRTGTSWAGKALGLAEGYTYIREPDNFDYVAGASRAAPYSYVTAGDARHPEYRHHLEQALTGGIITPFTMKEDEGPLLSHLPPRWRHALGRRFPALYRVRDHQVIKLVHANLALDWILTRFPDARIVYVLRHPCGQFQSVRRQGWEPQPERFLQDPAVVKDYVAEHVDRVRRAATFWERAGAQWGLVNTVVYRQAMRHDRLAIVPYEWLCANPVARFRKVYEWAGIDWSDAVDVFLSPPNPGDTSDSPYSLAKDPALQIDTWKQIISETDAAACRRAVEPFGLPFYNDFDPHAVAPIW